MPTFAVSSAGYDDMGLAAVIVILIYAATLAMIVLLPEELLGEKSGWARFWASFVAIVQMLVYALWG
ncbi:MAG TPA: hypothetical protein VEK15_23945 [Vicinamibacteria bacterium]|nr:hypothetical protein [Vicinamibacteria bacterium]